MRSEDRESFSALTDTQILALCIWGEARGEAYDGRRAVGSVVLNRVEQGGWYGKTIKEVILKPYQFSCFLEGDPNYVKLLRFSKDFAAAYKENVALRSCLDMSHGLLAGEIERNTKATHYKTLNCHAAWAEKLAKVDEIGHHEFFV